MHKEALKAIQDYLTEEPDVLLAYLFGSQLVGKPGPLSDFDFGFLVASPSSEVYTHLSHNLNTILNTDRIDIIFVDQAPIELAYAIIAQGKLIYQRDLVTRVETEAQILSQYGDYLPILRAQRHDILEGGRHEAGIQRYRTAFRRTERTLAAFRATPEQESK